MRRILASLALTAAVAAPALAQGDLTADTSLARADRMVKSVFLEDIKAVVANLGDTIAEVGGNGDVSVEGVSADDGLIYHVIGTICENEIRPGCLGVQIEVRYDGDEMVTLQKVNDANLTWAAVSAAVQGTPGTTDSTLVITRYVILDGGMTMQNVADNLTNAKAIARSLADYVWEVGDYAPDDEEW